MKEKLKSWLSDDRLFYGCLVILVGFISFYLGRASAFVTSPKDVPRVQYAMAPRDAEFVKLTPEGEKNNGSASVVVASKTGTKYHLPNCPGAIQIKPENLVTFNSVPEAEAAGYTPAANCPGL